MRTIPSTHFNSSLSKIDQLVKEFNGNPFMLPYSAVHDFRDNFFYINPSDFLSDAKEVPAPVLYQGSLFNQCKKSILTFNDKGSKAIHIDCSKEGEGHRVVLVGNGYGPPVVSQAYLLLKEIVISNPNVEIYLFELPGQGFTRVKDQKAESILAYKDAFREYEKDLIDLLKFIPPQKKPLTGIFLSSSCMPAIATLVKGYSKDFEFVLLSSLYPGLTLQDKVVQNILRPTFSALVSFGSTGKLKPLPMALPIALKWGDCPKDNNELISSLSSLDTVRSQFISPKSLDLLQLMQKGSLAQGGICEFGVQVQNVPFQWTWSATNYYDNLIEKLKKVPTSNQLKILWMTGTADGVADGAKQKIFLSNLKRVFKVDTIIVNGPHNSYINYPQVVANKASSPDV